MAKAKFTKTNKVRIPSKIGMRKLKESFSISSNFRHLREDCGGGCAGERCGIVVVVPGGRREVMIGEGGE